MNARTRRDPLAGTRPPFLPNPDDPHDPARRERDLRAILDQPQQVATTRRVGTRRLPVATLATAGVLVAAMIFALTTAADDPGPVRTPQQVLLAVADAAAKEATPAPGRYWHVRRHVTDINLMWPGKDHDEYLVTTESDAASWVSRTGAELSVTVDQLGLTTRALTDRDQAEWDRAGNPVGIPDASPAPDAPPAPPMPSTVPPSAIWMAGEQTHAIGGVQTPVSEVLTLPTDPARLRALLLDRFHTQPPTGGPTDETEWLMWEADTLLSGTVPTTPGTRAAAYRMLADLPGFRVMDGGELPDGSVGVARAVRMGWSYTVENALLEWQVVIDPDTGSLREWRLVLLEPGSERRRLPVGTVVHAETVEQVGWVDADPVLPAGTDEFGYGTGK
ncbi:CU044_5270 family protein [Actinophytocola sediminis]